MKRIINNWKQSLKHLFIIRELVRALRNSYVPKWKSNFFMNNIKVTQQNLDKKRVLFVTGGGGYAAAKQIDSLLAASLILRGADVDVLFCDAILPACFQTTIDWDRDEAKFVASGTTKLNCITCFTSAKKTFDRISVPIVRMSSAISPQERVFCENLSQSIDLNDIKNYSFLGIPVGEHAYAGALRFYATAYLIDEFSNSVLRKYLSASLQCAIAAKNLFSNMAKYDHVVLHHGIYVPQGVFADCARLLKIPVTTWHVAYRSGTFLFSHDDTYHKTLMNEPETEWSDFEFTPELKKKIVDYLQSRWAGSNDWVSFSNSFFKAPNIQNSVLKPSAKPRVLLLTNVMWDAQLHYPANAFPNMMEWIKYTIEYFRQRPEIELIIRVHPAEISGTLPSRQLVIDEIYKEFPILPENIILIGPEDPVNTYELAKCCNASVIYGTKTGVELTSMGIPTVVAGEAWIRGKGITIDVSDPNSYRAALDELPYSSRLTEETRDRALKYAYHFFFRRMIPLQVVKRVSGHEVFRFNFADASELMPGSDEGLDVICNGILNESPYVFKGKIS